MHDIFNRFFIKNMGDLRSFVNKKHRLHRLGMDSNDLIHETYVKMITDGSFTDAALSGIENVKPYLYKTTRVISDRIVYDVIRKERVRQAKEHLIDMRNIKVSQDTDCRDIFDILSDTEVVLVTQCVDTDRSVQSTCTQLNVSKHRYYQIKEDLVEKIKDELF
jgi:DNA-directed RNA polymerase specialized sigma24 family protein